VLLASITLLATPAPQHDLSAPFPVEAQGQVIDVDGGHAAPFLDDLDADGLTDLLVGQFSGGRLRVYRNVGEKTSPRFEGFRILRAGDADASVPFG
jgi:hypothetical protein